MWRVFILHFICQKDCFFIPAFFASSPNPYTHATSYILVVAMSFA